MSENISIKREITPVQPDDFFIIMNHVDAKFDYSVHYHPEYELNLVMETSGKRIVGDSILEYSGTDLVFIGPNTYHKWTGNNEGNGSHVITIQFPEDLFDQKLLDRKLMNPIKEMLKKSYRGITFSEPVKEQMKERILDLCNSHGFDSVLSFLSILYDLAISRNQELLASSTFKSEFEIPKKSRRIKKVVEYLQEHYQEDIMLSEVAQMVNMSNSAFSHFFKRRTQRSFSDYLIDIRIGHACRKLLETNHNISEICYNCGFNNLSNFNRLFKKNKGCTPSKFREYNQIITKY